MDCARREGVTSNPRVTALRPGPSTVAVELDGMPWRRLPVAVVVDAGLMVGCVVDRGRAREIARARRRRRAEQTALRALARRDQSRASLEARLATARIAPGDRRDVVDAATRAGLIDDGRFAERRAQQLAERGAGDLLVLDDLERQGVPADLAQRAVSTLEPELDRAVRVLDRRGRSARTLRHLAAKGFTEATIEALVAEAEGWALR